MVESRQTMIELSRLNGHLIVINAELIKSVEQNPDTVITLITGDKLVVRESASEVTLRVIAYRRSLLHRNSPMPRINPAQVDPNLVP
jgi:flagellar protein FlbD